MIAHANHYEALPLLGDTTNPPVHTRQRRLSDVTLGAGGLHVIYGTKRESVRNRVEILDTRSESTEKSPTRYRTPFAPFLS